MPKMEVTLTTVAEIEPALRIELETQLAAYAELDAEIKALSEAQTAIAGDIEILRESTGAAKLALDDGTKITRVSGGTTKSLNKKKLLEIVPGMTIGHIEQATTEKPKKAYTLITLPGQKDHSVKPAEEE